MSIIDIPILSRIRRNHGLEHATITILSLQFPHQRMLGYSLPDGFMIFSDLPTEHVREAVVQALARMNNGERRLAVHPNCGTNLLTSGFMAGLLAWLGLAGAKSKQEKIERLPLVIALVMIGLSFSQPLGPVIQERITTSGDPLDLAIVDVSPMKIGRFNLHRVTTRG